MRHTDRPRTPTVGQAAGGRSGLTRPPHGPRGIVPADAGANARDSSRIPAVLQGARPVTADTLRLGGRRGTEGQASPPGGVP